MKVKILTRFTDKINFCIKFDLYVLDLFKNRNLNKFQFIVIPFIILYVFLLNPYEGWSQNPSVRIEQLKNGAEHGNLSSVQWTRGAVQKNNSHYVEGESVPYRAIINNLVAETTYKFIISFDIIKNSKHGIDFITGPDLINEAIPDSDDYNKEFSIPLPPDFLNTYTYANMINSANMKMWIKGGVIETIHYSNNKCDFSSDTWADENDISNGPSKAVYAQIEFTTDVNSSNVEIVWGGHIAKGTGDWGINNGAASIKGAPIHTSAIALCLSAVDNPCSNSCFNVGHQDLPLSVSQSLTIVNCEVLSEMKVCLGEPVTLSVDLGDLTGDNYSYVWSKGNDILPGSNSYYDILSALQAHNGTYVLQVKNGQEVIKTCSIELTVNPLPLLVTNDPTVCAPLTVDLTAAAVTFGSDQDLAFSYWKEVDGIYEELVDTTISESGVYYVKAKNINNCFSDMKKVAVTVNPKPNVVAVNQITICAPATTTNLTLSSVTAGSGENLSFLYYDSNENVLTSSQAQSVGVGEYYIRSKNSTECLSDRVMVNVINDNCVFCGYTQGFYGNPSGTACLPIGFTVTGTPKSLNIMQKIMQSEMVFGGDKRKFKLRTADFEDSNANIFKMLPGGTTPATFKSVPSEYIVAYNENNQWGYIPISTSVKTLGRIENNLLSQTMTLFFNRKMNPLLDTYLLANSFQTSAVVCGTNTIIPASVKTFNMPSAVISYLNLNGGATVGNLFALANKVLGGESGSGLTPSQICNAVDIVNNAFDKCRVHFPLIIPTGSASARSSESELKEDMTFGSLNVEVYPIPFKNSLTLNFGFDSKTPVKIEMFDIRGVLLSSQVESDVYVNKEMPIGLNFSVLPSQVFFVKITSDKGSIVKKVISKE